MQQDLLHILSAGPEPPQRVHAVVEIPKGSVNKYEYDHETGAFHLNRVLRQTIFYPTEYGFIPHTWNKKDNDPMDIMVVSTFPTFTGCVLTVRPVGVILLNDTGEEDDKIIAVPESDPRFEDIQEIDDFPSHFKPEIENFFKHYSSLDPDKNVVIEGWKSKKIALQMIEEGMEGYRKAFKNKRSLNPSE